MSSHRDGSHVLCENIRNTGQHQLSGRGVLVTNVVKLEMNAQQRSSQC